MQIDSAVVSVLLGIKSHDEVSSFKSVFGKHEHTKGTLKEGASMSINALEQTRKRYSASIHHTAARCSTRTLTVNLEIGLNSPSTQSCQFNSFQFVASFNS